MRTKIDKIYIFSSELFNFKRFLKNVCRIICWIQSKKISATDLKNLKFSLKKSVSSCNNFWFLAFYELCDSAFKRFWKVNAENTNYVGVGWVVGTCGLKNLDWPRNLMKIEIFFFAFRKEKVNLATFEIPPVKNALCSSPHESFSTCVFLITGVNWFYVHWFSEASIVHGKLM
jgi:hypothetical protein